MTSSPPRTNYKPGDTVNLTVYRDGKTITVKLTLEESTPEKTAQQDQAQKEYEEQQQQQLQQEQRKARRLAFRRLWVLILYIVCSTTK